ncbi:thioesterase family protein [Iodobacter sp. CM08]|uniref:acyl-CoA thioesterase n=1 Tax=Iodobacter sp. CM08 TaxID=3085902 RepID=UPI00298299F6|nr:thioesterase family protein [Iodobacter sp. CM08]MDW5417828.1 thioesterase family protein [Iodobacter sp. CM08]
MIKTETKILVQGFHCDAYGHVNNARYQEFLEQARTDFWNAHGKAWFNERNIGAVVAEFSRIQYKRPCGPDDELSVVTQWDGVPSTEAWVVQDIMKGPKVALSARLKLVFFDTQTKRSLPLSGELLDRISPAQ